MAAERDRILDEYERGKLAILERIARLPVTASYLQLFRAVQGHDGESWFDSDWCPYAYTMRDELRRRFAFAIPTERALDVCARYAPIVEIGAGTGYWAHLLRQRGADILAYDAHPPSGRGQYGFEHEWTPVLRGRTRKAGQFPGRTLMLCWPPYDDPMAARALELYRGRHVIYIGEGYGGCTGDDDFHRALEREWEEIEEVPIPTWTGIHDRMLVYRRAGTPRPPGERGDG